MKTGKDNSQTVRRVSIVQGRSEEKAMAPHSSTVASKTHGRRSLVGCRLWVAQSQIRLKRLSSSSSGRPERSENSLGYFQAAVVHEGGSFTTCFWRRTPRGCHCVSGEDRRVGLCPDASRARHPGLRPLPAPVFSAPASIISDLRAASQTVTSQGGSQASPLSEPPRSFNKCWCQAAGPRQPD